MGDFVVQKGDAITMAPIGQGLRVLIPHLCNDEGKWGKGFVVALSNVYPEAEKAYRDLASYKLGDAHFVQSSNPTVTIANMIAQRGIRSLRDGSMDGCPPIRYNALYESMSKVASWLAVAQSSGPIEVHCPKFGAGLAGGSWPVIELMIRNLWAERSNCKVVVCEFDKEPVP